MKVGFIGHVDHGKTTLIQELIKAVEVKTGEKIECVSIHENETDFLKQPILEKAINYTNEMRCNLFTPPMSRAERRKLKRKK